MIFLTQRSTTKNQPLLLWLLTLSVSMLAMSSSDAAINKKPIAKITKVPAVNEQTLVQLIGTGSKDRDIGGSIASYFWESKDTSVALTNANAAEASFTAPLVKKITKLTFYLTVTDDQGAQAKATTVITIKPVNTPPSAVAGTDQNVFLAKPVTLDGSNSNDNTDGEIKSWRWTQIGSGPRVKLIGSTTINPTFISPKKLAKNITSVSLKFKLTVTDDENSKSYDEVIVTVQSEPVVPPVNVSLNLENKDFTDTEIIARDTSKTLTWTVKNTSDIDLTNVALTQGTATGDLTVDTISPATIASWAKDTNQTFSVSVNAAANAAAGTNTQSWSLTYDNGKPLAFNSISFSLTTEALAECSAPITAKAAAIANLSKINSTGSKIPDSSSQWSCVQDNNSKLMWEVKSDDNGLHDKDWTYSWYQPNASNAAGNIGEPNGGDCGKLGIDCDTESFVQAVNTKGWCGHNDWRMPSDDELLSLVSPMQAEPVIDVNYFPRTQQSMYWSSSPTEDAKYAWYVSFGKGYHAWNLKDSARYTRLVRNVK